jgi:hypothetical protein
MESAQVPPTEEWMDAGDVVCIHNEVLLGHKEQ